MSPARLALFALLLVACSKDKTTPAPAASSSTTPEVSAAPSAAASAPASASVEPPPVIDEGPAKPLTLEELMAAVQVHPSKWQKRRVPDPAAYLRKVFGLESPARMNQGNPAIAHHAISKAKCLKGLEGVVLQTAEQREICGFENMVPVYQKGKKPKACIDIFEFPNIPCELPVVWSPPVQADIVCKLQGKRLCSQEEWSRACRVDPEGGPDSTYAYGKELDLEVCNTNKRPSALSDTACNGHSAKTAWETCGTNTEPSGSFPECRSKSGVYDQHGNVAEIMTRLDADGILYDQLKGSAFFYVDVARKENERPPKGRETYPDHCNYSPRWHVQPMSEAGHNNYHLGFRCCSSVD